MLSFHNDQKIKDKYIARVKAHAAADEIIKGSYWSNGKGCAVGCTIHGSQHSAYEDELGIPRILARLEDGIFEGLPNDIAKDFPLRFLSAVPVGVDLSPVFPKFMHWLLVDNEHGIIKFASEKGKIAIQGVADLYERKIAGESISYDQWMEARKPADAAAAYAAAYAADADAAAADADAYAYAAAYAADADAAAADAADAAAYAADAAAYAADADAYAADAAAYAAYAAAYARQKARTIQADKLIELISECK